MSNTKELYDDNAGKWVRNTPVSLSDFTGRPAVIELCGNLKGLDVLDMGCGEGYVSRELLKQPLSSLKGVDISNQMIDLASSQNRDERAEFKVGNATQLEFSNDSFDLVVAVFVYNYLFIGPMLESMKEVYRVLKPGGSFVFSVPHPSFPFIEKKTKDKFDFNFGEDGYFLSRDKRAEGQIKRLDGEVLPVQMCHKLMQDYFYALSSAGFNKIPQVEELGVKPEHLEMNPDFFTDLNDIPLHVAFKVVK